MEVSEEEDREVENNIAVDILSINSEISTINDIENFSAINGAYEATDRQLADNGIDRIPDEQQYVGSISISNSQRVTVGNKVYYQGPITIQQHVTTG